MVNIIEELGTKIENCLWSADMKVVEFDSVSEIIQDYLIKNNLVFANLDLSHEYVRGFNQGYAKGKEEGYSEGLVN